MNRSLLLFKEMMLNNHMEFDKLYRRLMLEFSEGAIRNIVKKFQNDATEQEIRRELQDFEKYKNSLQKKDPFQYQSWIEFTEAIHAAKGKAEFKKKKAPTQDVVANQDDIVADDENVTIYRGDSQDKCVLYGKGYTFCISRQAGGNMFSNYRLGKDSTFYFIYFKKKPKSATDHIMVLDHTNKGYEWTFADNNTKEVKGGWSYIIKKYPELQKYKKILINKKLNNDERDIIDKLRIFSKNAKLSDFQNFSYKEKAQALKSVNNIPDEIWNILDPTLRNEFLSVGPNLTKFQVNNLKANEIERYKKTREASIDQLMETGLVIPNEFDSDDKFLSHDNRNAAIYLAHFKYDDTNVPANVIRRIVGSSDSAFQYAQLAQRKTPYEIYDSLDSERAGIIAHIIFKWEDVPRNLFNRAKRSVYGVPDNATIQESFQFNREYKKLLKQIGGK
jgi:hypothetical protein